MTRRLALTALLAVGLAACQIPQGLEQVVNQGAQTHANEHVADGTPTDRVLCAIPDGAGGYETWLIPSVLVAKWGTCGLAYARATSIMCDLTFCYVLGDNGTTPLLQPPATTTVTVIDRAPG